MSSTSTLTVQDSVGRTSVAINMRVWIISAPGVARNIVGASGFVDGVTASGRVLVRFDADAEIVRRLGYRAIYITPAALTCVNPFLAR